MSTKGSLLRRSLIWIGLSCVMAGGPAGAMANTSGYAASWLRGLATALDGHGWSTSADADGSLLVHRASDVAATRRVADGDSRLTDAMARRGWNMRRDAAGNVLLIPAV